MHASKTISTEIIKKKNWIRQGLHKNYKLIPSLELLNQVRHTNILVLDISQPLIENDT